MSGADDTLPAPAGPDRVERFDRFVADAEPRLRRALVAALGQQLGVEATSIALAYGWEHCDGSALRALHRRARRLSR